MAPINKDLKYTPVHIGKLIRAELKRQGMSIERFHRSIGVSRTYANKIFGQADIYPKRLRVISELLGVDFLAFMAADHNRKELTTEGRAAKLSVELNTLNSQLQARDEQINQLEEAALGKKKETEGEQLALNARITELETLLQNTQAELEVTKAEKLEAEIQVRVLEGKLEVLLPGYTPGVKKNK